MSNTTITPTVATGLALAGVSGANLITVTPTVNTFVQGEAATLVWPSMANGSPGAPTPKTFVGRPHRFSDGTSRAGGSVQVESSNDGVTWVKASPAALTSAGFFAALGGQERPLLLRPNVTAGDGTTSLTVTGWLNRSATCQHYTTPLLPGHRWAPNTPQMPKPSPVGVNSWRVRNSN